MERDKIHIAMVVDGNYLLPAIVAVYSLYESNAENNIAIYILCAGNCAEIASALMPLSRDNFKIAIIRQEAGETFFVKEGFHVSSTAALKFRLPSILSEIEKVLYLDCDLLVTENLRELWNTPIDEFYGAFVKDIKPVIKYPISQLRLLGIEDHGAYFNSGVMLLNLDAMRRDNLEEKLYNYRKHGLNKFMDQDAFNYVLGGKALFINLRFNFMVTLLNEFDVASINANYGMNLSNDRLFPMPPAAIIHYSSSDKPWNSTKPPYTDAWWACLARYMRKTRPILPERLQHLNSYDKIIVSLTSYSKRVHTVDQVIRNLKDQSLRAAKIILWLSGDEFAWDMERLPVQLASLLDESFEIKFCKDLKSYKKLIPSLKLWPDKVIATADDDQIYNRNWLLELFQSYLAFPDAVHCHRGHKITFSCGQVENYNHWLYNHKQEKPSQLLFPTGCGGILYPPHCFAREVFNKDMFMEICDTGDDIWFWAMALMKNRKFRILQNSSYEATPIDGTQEISLYHRNITEHANDNMLKNVIFYYPFIKSYIFNEYYNSENFQTNKLLNIHNSG